MNKLRRQLDVCRVAAQSVYAHLDEHGVSVGIVFRLRQLAERILRIQQLLDCMLADQPDRATAALLADLALLGQDNRSIRALVAHSSGLTAAKVAERSAETGEHYITRNAAEYKEMLGKAAGGGFVLAFTTWIKFGLVGLGLSAFWGGFAAGLNYASCFVLIMLLRWTVATKQPAMTAPAMAANASAGFKALWWWVLIAWSITSSTAWTSSVPDETTIRVSASAISVLTVCQSPPAAMAAWAVAAWAAPRARRALTSQRPAKSWRFCAWRNRGPMV